MTRMTVLGLSCGLLLPACHSGTVLEGDAPGDGREDVGGDVPSDARDTPPDPGADADPDADADVGPDVPVECPPLMDGSWLTFEIDGGSFDDADVDLPCRLALLIGGPPGHVVVQLECGTGGIIETHTIDFFANPPPDLARWDGTEVTFRYIADMVWWVNRWFTVRDSSGTLLFAGVSADNIAPWGTDPSTWYAPLGVRVASGVCPVVDESCGPHERQAVEVTYGGETELIFDGYRGTVGGIATADVHVGGATHYVEMRCDDVPDAFYTVLFVLAPDAPECSVDDDCSVALPEERCCSPDPQAVPRAALAADHCLHELGTAWTEIHDDCWRECFACQPMDRRFYAARCSGGRCVGVEDFCAPLTAPASTTLLDASVVPEGGWDQYQGQLITLHGWPRLGPTSSECTPEPDECFSTPVQRTLACNVTLQGSTCGIPWNCSGPECDPTCTPDSIYGELWLDGYLVSDVGGWELWPTTAADECAPAGPNPEGAACTPWEDGQCQDGLICFYWGDVIVPCAGICRPPGTECEVEGDCAPGDTCYEGYCVWCCPG